MKAWQLTAANEPLALIERDDPEPESGQVVVDVRAAGICHSDVGFLDGTLTSMLPHLPMIPGHEVAGVISALGPDVDGVYLGQRVVIGLTEHGAPGWSSDGGFATKCVAAAKGLIALTDSVDFDQAAIATDAGQTAYGAVVRAAKVRAGDRVGIIGLGGLGLTGARIAVLIGAQVYAAEPKRDVWDVARERGVIDVVDDIRDLETLGLDIIIDFAGYATTTAGAISAARVGGRVVQVGLGVNEATIPTADLVFKEVTLRGARGGHPGDLEAVLDYMTTGELVIPTEPITFDDIPAAIERLRAGGVTGRLVACSP